MSKSSQKFFWLTRKCYLLVITILWMVLLIKNNDESRHYILCDAFSVSVSSNKNNYPQQVLEWLQTNSEDISITKVRIPAIQRHRDLIALKHKKKNNEDDSYLLLHLVPTPTCQEELCDPQLFQQMTNILSSSSSSSLPVEVYSDNDYDENEISRITSTKSFQKVIHLHQDVWIRKKPIVKRRLLTQLGVVFKGRIYARKTTVRRINATIAMEFLKQHHLWGATRAKYYYGLFLSTDEEEELVAVATFSSRRKVKRNNQIYKSHELLRYCSQCDTSVIGGISKLCKYFIQDVQPDDIITVVDRDWGGGSGWHSLGFQTVAIMNPILMVIHSNDISHGIRRHLVGAGIKNTTNNDENSDRPGVSQEVLLQLNHQSTPQNALQCLIDNDFYPVYDSGVERLFKVITPNKIDDNGDEYFVSPKDLWEKSQPRYASSYYSPNNGITALLQKCSGYFPNNHCHSNNTTTLIMDATTTK